MLGSLACVIPVELLRRSNSLPLSLKCTAYHLDAQTPLHLAPCPVHSPTAHDMYSKLIVGGIYRFIGIDYSSTSQCTDVNVGYDFSYLGDLNDRSDRVIIKSLAGSLLLNPIAAVFAGVSLFWAFFAWFFASRIMEIVRFSLILRLSEIRETPTGAVK